MGNFRKAIDNYQNSCISAGRRKMGDEIHGQVFPESSGWCNRLKESRCLLRTILNLLTDHTSSNKILNILGHCWPEKIFLQSVKGLNQSKVTTHRG